MACMLTCVDLVLDGRQLFADGSYQVVTQLARQEGHAHILEVSVTRVGLEELELLVTRRLHVNLQQVNIDATVLVATTY